MKRLFLILVLLSTTKDTLGTPQCPQPLQNFRPWIRNIQTAPVDRIFNDKESCEKSVANAWPGGSAYKFRWNEAQKKCELDGRCAFKFKCPENKVNDCTNLKEEDCERSYAVDGEGDTHRCYYSHDKTCKMGQFCYTD